MNFLEKWGVNGIFELSPQKAFQINQRLILNLIGIYLTVTLHKRLDNVLGRRIISNYGTPTEKDPEFLDHHLQSVMKSGVSYIKDSVLY